MNRDTYARAQRALTPWCGLLLLAANVAHADDGNSLTDALLSTSPLVNIRVRHEEVDQAGIADNADANTLRARLGAQTGTFLDTALLAEVEAMVRLDRDYRPDNAVATYTQYPVVPDPENDVVNRLQLSNTSLPQTTVTVGRQRIVLDDQRFVGNSDWRQNEVTFDAVRAVNQSIDKLTVDATFLNKVHRVYGVDSPQGTYKGDSYLINLAYELPFGKLTGFAYLLDFDPITGLTGALDPRRGSTSTVGGRFIGDWPVAASTGIGYAVSYASQKPRADNPMTFTNDYFMAEINAHVGPFTWAGGEEVLHGNGLIGFATPLATLHLFEGWANKFLTTPADGIDDRYTSVGWTTKNIAGLDTLSESVVYHAFDAQSIDADYGREWDLLLKGKRGHYTGTLKYASYSAAASTPLSLARNTEKFWAQIDYIL